MMAAADVLSDRQRQIADGIRRGLTYAEIAGELTRRNRRNLSPATVQQHVTAMAEKLRRVVRLEPDEDPDHFAPREIVARWMQQRTRPT